MKIYIAGRVTNLLRSDAERNFNRGVALLRAKNHVPVNPLNEVHPAMNPRECMAVLLPLMLQCEAIMLLDGWEFSEGAKIELAVARYTGMKIFSEDDLV